jgi:hypothetical protein
MQRVQKVTAKDGGLDMQWQPHALVNHANASSHQFSITGDVIASGAQHRTFKSRLTTRCVAQVSLNKKCTF